MQIETWWVPVEDLSIPHLTGSRSVTDPFGVMRVESISWVYLGDGKYCEAEQWSATEEENST